MELAVVSADRRTLLKIPLEAARQARMHDGDLSHRLEKAGEQASKELAKALSGWTKLDRTTRTLLFHRGFGAR